MPKYLAHLRRPHCSVLYLLQDLDRLPAQWGHDVTAQLMFQVNCPVVLPCWEIHVQEKQALMMAE